MGLSIDACILIMGVLCIIYTACGGMEAVVWTGVTQVIILSVGAVICLLFIAFSIDGGWEAMVTTAERAGKYEVFDFHLSTASTGFFVVLFGTLAQNFVSYGTDQAVIQRYLTTPDIRASARSIWTNAALTVPISLIFFSIGAALYSYYATYPEQLDPTLTKPESLLPLFIVEHLPAGIAGLIIAAVFAASMSSIDSAMNSVSAAMTTDFYRRFNRSASELSALRFARVVTVTVGLAGIAIALMMAHTKIDSVWDQFTFFLGLFGGGLGGVFLLGVFTRRTHGVAAVVGLFASAATQFWLIQSGAVSSWFFAFTGMATCAIIGYVVSLIVPGKQKDISQLTLWT